MNWPTTAPMKVNLDLCRCGNPTATCASCEEQACLGDEDTGQCGITGEQAYHVEFCCRCWGDCSDEQGGIS